jgi:hypothetical protein
MTIELDHVFVMCAAGAPEADALTRVGLTEGPPNAHAGQGTSCRRFFFERQYIELVWVHDAEQAHADRAQWSQVARLGLTPRWTNRHATACLFGILLRPSAGVETLAVPFRTWRYTPAYLPPGVGIDVADDVPLTEPFIAVMGAQRGPVRRDPVTTQHRLPVSSMTHVTIGMPHQPRATAARWLITAGLVTFERTDDYLLRVTLDDGVLGRAADLRPELALTLRW